MRQYPHLYEVNARLFLRRQSEKYQRALTLATIPEAEWQSLRKRGFDLVWLMGVWQRSPAARREALLNTGLRQELERALPDWTDKDVTGSPYAVYSYTLDPLLGETEELLQLKSILHRQGIQLILDFVPNHLALDHPWTSTHPEWFVNGKEIDLHLRPDCFYSSANGVCFAHGRDPYFPPWSDTVQVNVFSVALRQALTGELLRIAEVTDGVRCDMAMLMLNEVFQRVWGENIGKLHQPRIEFWTEAITAVRQRFPGFLFLGEVYWGYERKLQQMGFNFTYDKTLYDRLRFGSASEIRDYIAANVSCQKHMLRFIENHDELRAIAAFGRPRSLAVAIVLATLPGLRLFHDGQFEGHSIRVPVQLVREPKEVADDEMTKFYDRLLPIADAAAFHDGQWGLLKADQAWTGNLIHDILLAWSWRYGRQLKVVAVNYSPHPAQGWLKIPLPEEADEKLTFQDELTGATYIRDVSELRTKGLYLDLRAYQSHIMSTDY